MSLWSVCEVCAKLTAMCTPFNPVQLVTTPAEQETAFQIRRVVFMQEQNVSEAEEMDGLDDQAHHILYWTGSEAVGTARLRIVETEGVEWGKLERIAVLKPWRGKGIGQALVKGLIELGRDDDLTHFKLGAQCEAIGFYEKLGFTGYGEVFMDARIPHRMMKRIF